MKHYLAVLSATALFSVAPFALAASSTDLTVTGTITPSACTPSLAGGGMVDLGKISAGDLRQDGITRLEKQYLGFSVACDAATVFAIESIDNRDGTSYASGAGRFGVGLTNAGEKLGAYHVNTITALTDGQPAEFVSSIDGGQTWRPDPSMHPEALFALSAPGTQLPIPATNATVELEIEPFIARADGLTLTDEVTIDGSATFEVKYL